MSEVSIPQKRDRLHVAIQRKRQRQMATDGSLTLLEQIATSP